MGDRQADLQNAFADGDDVQILELTSRMAKGAELLIQLTSLRCGERLARGGLPRTESSFSVLVSEAIGKQSRVFHQEFQIWFARL